VSLDLDVHLSAIAAGDAQAFALWLAGAEGILRGRLRSFAGSVDTEAVLQESMLRVWQVAPKFKPDGRPNSLLRLACRICRNYAVDEIRRAGRSPIELLDADAAVEVSAPDPLLRRAIALCREALPAAPARALSLRLDACGARHDRELAERAEMTLNTFLKNVGRARKLLVECLRKRGIALETT